jgi:hypothetical protein
VPCLSVVDGEQATTTTPRGMMKRSKRVRRWGGRPETPGSRSPFSLIHGISEKIQDEREREREREKGSGRESCPPLERTEYLYWINVRYRSECIRNTGECYGRFRSEWNAEWPEMGWKKAGIIQYGNALHGVETASGAISTDGPSDHGVIMNDARGGEGDDDDGR